MTNVKVKLGRDIGQIDGWLRYDIEIGNTEYQYRNIYSGSGFCWDKETKQWTRSGCIKADYATAEQLIKTKILSKISNPALAEVTHE